MGGVFLEQTGEAGMPGEFNVWSDPEAAHAVLHSGAPLRFVGLDVTRRVRLSRYDAAALEAAARADEKIAAWLDGATVRRVVAVPGRLVNFVLG